MVRRYRVTPDNPVRVQDKNPCVKVRVHIRNKNGRQVGGIQDYYRSLDVRKYGRCDRAKVRKNRSRGQWERQKGVRFKAHRHIKFRAYDDDGTAMRPIPGGVRRQQRIEREKGPFPRPMSISDQRLAKLHRWIINGLKKARVSKDPDVKERAMNSVKGWRKEMYDKYNDVQIKRLDRRHKRSVEREKKRRELAREAAIAAREMLEAEQNEAPGSPPPNDEPEPYDDPYQDPDPDPGASGSRSRSRSRSLQGITTKRARSARRGKNTWGKKPYTGKSDRNADARPRRLRKRPNRLIES